MQALIIIPTYNEKANITRLITALKNIRESFSILVVDDNSPDKTAQAVKALQTRYKGIYLIKRAKRLGLGSAYQEGFRCALENGYDVVVQMDADLSHSPKYLPHMLNLLNGCDLVIGSRYVKGGGIEQWGFIRRFLSLTANKFARWVLKVPIYDLTSGFKCIRKEALEKIDLSFIKSQGYAFQIEISYRAYLKGLRIVEYPIVFRGRKKDKSKMSFGIIIEAFLRVLAWV